MAPWLLLLFVAALSTSAVAQSSFFTYFNNPYFLTSPNSYNGGDDLYTNHATCSQDDVVSWIFAIPTDIEHVPCMYNEETITWSDPLKGEMSPRILGMAYELSSCSLSGLFSVADCDNSPVGGFNSFIYTPRPATPQFGEGICQRSGSDCDIDDDNDFPPGTYCDCFGVLPGDLPDYNPQDNCYSSVSDGYYKTFQPDARYGNIFGQEVFRYVLGNIPRVFKSYQSCGSFSGNDDFFRLSDNNHIMGVQTIQHHDHTEPVIEAPYQILLECNKNSDPYNYDAHFADVRVHDMCDPRARYELSDQNVDLQNPGNYRVEFTGRDHCFNEGITTTYVKVVDSTPPVVHINDLVVNTTYQCSLPAIGTLDVTASDSCSDTVNLDTPNSYDSVFTQEQCPYAGHGFFTVDAFDGAGNTISERVVLYFEDTVAPQLSTTPLYANRSGTRAEFQCFPSFSVASDDVDFTDNCSPAVQIDYESNGPFQSIRGQYDASYRWTARDDCNNVAEFTYDMRYFLTQNVTLTTTPGSLSFDVAITTSTSNCQLLTDDLQLSFNPYPLEFITATSATTTFCEQTARNAGTVTCRFTGGALGHPVINVNVALSEPDQFDTVTAVVFAVEVSSTTYRLAQPAVSVVAIKN